MRRNQALALVFALAAALTGCSTADNANTATNANNTNASTAASPQRDGVVDVNANIPGNANRQSVSSNTGVLTNNNGNENTAGVKSVNSNKANGNRNRRP